MKNFFTTLCFLAFLILPAYSTSAPITASEAKAVEDFFDSYVDSANNYKDDLANHYSHDAVIQRIVIKKDGTKQTVDIPLKRYFKELKQGKKMAKLVNYKNTYTNKRYEKINDDTYKITTTRIPFKDKTGLNAEFTIKKTPFGFKISQEAMETNVQKFLSAK